MKASYIVLIATKNIGNLQTTLELIEKIQNVSLNLKSAKTVELLD